MRGGGPGNSKSPTRQPTRDLVPHFSDSEWSWPPSPLCGPGESTYHGGYGPLPIVQGTSIELVSRCRCRTGGSMQPGEDVDHMKEREITFFDQLTPSRPGLNRRSFVTHLVPRLVAANLAFQCRRWICRISCRRRCCMWRALKTDQVADAITPVRHQDGPISGDSTMF